MLPSCLCVELGRRGRQRGGRSMNERAGWNHAWVGFLFTGYCNTKCVCSSKPTTVFILMNVIHHGYPWDPYYTILYTFKAIKNGCYNSSINCQTELNPLQSLTFSFLFKLFCNPCSTRLSVKHIFKCSPPSGCARSFKNRTDFLMVGTRKSPCEEEIKWRRID